MATQHSNHANQTGNIGKMSMSGGHGGYTHMTFFWGKNSEILFTGWPGTRGGHYAQALIVCFLLAVSVEWLSACRLTKPTWSDRQVKLTRLLLHTLRVILAYLLMLAVMSFNVGVLIVTVAGHTFAFWLFGLNSGDTKPDLPPLTSCCG